MGDARIEEVANEEGARSTVQGLREPLQARGGLIDGFHVGGQVDAFPTLEQALLVTMRNSWSPAPAHFPPIASLQTRTKLDAAA